MDINIEVETSSLLENTRTLYAIGLTENEHEEDWTSFLDGTTAHHKDHITDIVLILKDVTIIIEAKRTTQDCKEQLLQQALRFTKTSHPIKTKIFHRSWVSVLQILKKVHHLHVLRQAENIFTASFLKLIETKYNHWIPTIPFSSIRLNGNNSNGFIEMELNKRLAKAMNSLGNDAVISFADRRSIVMHQTWAKEAIPIFSLQGENAYLILQIWPGNTKQQGYSLYHNSLNWTNLSQLNINGTNYPVHIERHLKFMHFNSYVTHLNIPMNNHTALRREINTLENFRKHSGLWERSRWQELDTFMNDHLSIDWKTIAHWDECFEHTQRNYLTLALGFVIEVHIPYADLQNIDSTPKGYIAVGKFLADCIQQISIAIEAGL